MASEEDRRDEATRDEDERAEPAPGPTGMPRPTSPQGKANPPMAGEASATEEGEKASDDDEPD